VYPHVSVIIRVFLIYNHVFLWHSPSLGYNGRSHKHYFRHWLVSAIFLYQSALLALMRPSSTTITHRAILFQNHVFLRHSHSVLQNAPFCFPSTFSSGTPTAKFRTATALNSTKFTGRVPPSYSTNHQGLAILRPPCTTYPHRATLFSIHVFLRHFHVSLQTASCFFTNTSSSCSPPAMVTTAAAQTLLNSQSGFRHFFYQSARFKLLQPHTTFRNSAFLFSNHVFLIPSVGSVTTRAILFSYHFFLSHYHFSYTSRAILYSKHVFFRHSHVSDTTSEI